MTLTLRSLWASTFLQQWNNNNNNNNNQIASKMIKNIALIFFSGRSVADEHERGQINFEKIVFASYFKNFWTIIQHLKHFEPLLIEHN